MVFQFIISETIFWSIVDLRCCSSRSILLLVFNIALDSFLPSPPLALSLLLPLVIIPALNFLMLLYFFISLLLSPIFVPLVPFPVSIPIFPLVFSLSSTSASFAIAYTLTHLTLPVPLVLLILLFLSHL